MRTSARHRLAIVVVLGLSALLLGQANAQQSTATELLSSPFGITFGQVARITVAHVGDPGSRSGAADEEITVHIQLLDTEGAVIAQSDPIRVNPGEMRFWDVPREVLPAGESNGRTQIRARGVMPGRLATTRESPVQASLEVVDAGTGATAFIEEMAIRGITVGCGGGSFCP